MKEENHPANCPANTNEHMFWTSPVSKSLKKKKRTQQKITKIFRENHSISDFHNFIPNFRQINQLKYVDKRGFCWNFGPKATLFSASS